MTLKQQLPPLRTNSAVAPDKDATDTSRLRLLYLAFTNSLKDGAGGGGGGGLVPFP